MDMSLSQILSLLTATILGAAIGLERELSQKAAGLRTNTLICLGACLFTLVSKEMGMLWDGSATRIAAGVVGGIGFLGAGAIIQDRSSVHGITTAATIWLVASVGLACGAGFYLLAVFATILAGLTLLGMKPLENRLRRRVSRNDKIKKDNFEA